MKLPETFTLITVVVGFIGVAISLYTIIGHFRGIKLVKIKKHPQKIFISLHNKNSRFTITLQKVSLRPFCNFFKSPHITLFEKNELKIKPRKTEDIQIPFFYNKKCYLLIDIKYEIRGNIIRRNFIKQY